MAKNVQKPAAAGPSGEVRAAEFLYKLALKKAKAAGDDAKRFRKKMKAAKKAAKRAKRAYRLAKRELAMAELALANAKAPLAKPVRPASAAAAKSGDVAASRLPGRKPKTKAVATKKAKKPAATSQVKESRKARKRAAQEPAQSIAPVPPPIQEQSLPCTSSPEPNEGPSPS